MAGRAHVVPYRGSSTVCGWSLSRLLQGSKSFLVPALHLGHAARRAGTVRALVTRSLMGMLHGVAFHEAFYLGRDHSTSAWQHGEGRIKEVQLNLVCHILPVCAACVQQRPASRSSGPCRPEHGKMPARKMLPLPEQARASATLASSSVFCRMPAFHLVYMQRLRFCFVCPPQT